MIKCIEKTSVGLWGRSKPIKLPGVTTARSNWLGCYNWYQDRPSWFHARAWARCPYIVFMAHVDPKWSRAMAYVPTLDT
jgi:hypothetical protein